MYDSELVNKVNQQWLDLQDALAEANNPKFKDPKEFPPPGNTVLILQDTGTVILGKWKDGMGCVKWYPIPEK
jgi:hypothetical protein